MSQRQEYDMSYKLDAVRKIEEQGYTVPEATKSLGVQKRIYINGNNKIKL